MKSFEPNDYLSVISGYILLHKNSHYPIPSKPIDFLNSYLVILPLMA